MRPSTKESRGRVGPRPWAFAIAAALVVSLAFAALGGLGPELPGPPVREWLGLTDGDDEFASCTPELREERNPRRPPPSAGSWRQEPTLPIELGEMTAGAADETIYVGTGLSKDVVSDTRMFTFDPATGRYGAIPDAPQPLDHAAVETWNGDLYLVGGLSNGTPSDGLWRYSPADRSWSELASMPTARGAIAAGVIGDRLFVVGGTPENPPGSSQPYGELEIYDLRSDTWSTGPAMPEPRHHLAGAALGGDLYVVGGRRPGEYSADTFQRFDPQTNRWQALPPLPHGVGGAQAVSAGGRVIVIGGGDELETWVTPAVWSFDPGGGRWTRLPDLRRARHVHAVASAGGRIYVFGGARCAGNNTFDQTRTVESLELG